MIIERWENGELIEVIDDGVPFTYPPLDPTGALATLLVVTGALTLHDAAAAIHEEENHLIAEAEAWSLGGQ